MGSHGLVSYSAKYRITSRVGSRLDEVPELRWLDRLAPLVALLFAGSTYCGGELFRHYAPDLKTSGPQLLVWVFFISTVALYHATYCVNSLARICSGVGDIRRPTGAGTGCSWPCSLLEKAGTTIITTTLRLLDRDFGGKSMSRITSSSVYSSWDSSGACAHSHRTYSSGNSNRELAADTSSLTIAMVINSTACRL